MAQDYSRLQRADWDKMGATALAQEIVNILNTAPITKEDPASDGWFMKATEAGSGSTYTLTLDAGGDAWFSGAVVSGSGTTYSVRLDSGTLITATVPRVLQTNNQTIPAAAQAVVIKLSDNTYRIVLATWVTQV